MNKTGPIVIIEDDHEDQEILQMAFDDLQLGNEILFFSDGESALTYLLTTTVEPFLVFSDINMPKISGFELRERLHEDPEAKIAVPFLFFTTATDPTHVTDAYSRSIQGFFIKPHDFTELKSTIKAIVDYWQRCV
jgi:CheY-like chemotaxis protein